MNWIVLLQPKFIGEHIYFHCEGFGGKAFWSYQPQKGYWGWIGVTVVRMRAQDACSSLPEIEEDPSRKRHFSGTQCCFFKFIRKYLRITVICKVNVSSIYKITSWIFSSILTSGAGKGDLILQHHEFAFLGLFLKHISEWWYWIYKWYFPALSMSEPEPVSTTPSKIFCTGALGALWAGSWKCMVRCLC